MISLFNIHHILTPILLNYGHTCLCTHNRNSSRRFFFKREIAARVLRSASTSRCHKTRIRYKIGSRTCVRSLVVMNHRTEHHYGQNECPICWNWILLRKLKLEIVLLVTMEVMIYRMIYIFCSWTKRWYCLETEEGDGISQVPGMDTDFKISWKWLFVFSTVRDHIWLRNSRSCLFTFAGCLPLLWI